MIDQNLVSIIVPVYNVEKYLDQCIKSILNQTYHNLEIILINDGSTDRSEEICLRYVAIDERIAYYKQSNGGLSAARNAGILKSKGTYIQFLDSDDYLFENSVEVLVKAIQGVDYVIAGYYNVKNFDNHSNTLIASNYLGLYQKNGLLPHWGELVEEEIFHYAWNKLYKGEFIKDRISFNEAIVISEDMIFNLDYLSGIDLIRIIKEPVCYHVLFNQDSLTKRYHPGMFEMRRTTHKHIENFLLLNNIYDGNNYDVAQKLYSKRIKNIFMLLTSKKTKLNASGKLTVIKRIVEDDSVQNVVDYLRPKPLSKITGYLIYHKRQKTILLLYSVVNVMLSVESTLKKNKKRSFHSIF